MTVLRDVEREIDRFRGRLLAAAGFVLVAFALLAARLVYLQVIRHDELATQAEANRIAVVPVVPNRGQIVDRNGVVLATNYAAYTLEVSPRRFAGREGEAELDGLVEQLADLVEIGPRDRRRFKRLREELKGADSLPIRTRLTDEEVARFTAQRFRFPGVEIKARLFRNYPLGETGSHLLGYIGRINVAEKKAMEEWDEADQGNYKGTEYIGKLGLEQSYESRLHGQAGYEEVETSAAGRAVRRLDSRPPTPGDKLVLSVDIRLQALVEEMFGDRRGALVALDPRSGEVLAFVSKPTFDPNLFVDGIDIESWRELNESIDKPLLNRALRGTYPPGSTFKPFMAIAALNSGKRNPGTVIHDGGTFQFGNHTFRSHGDHGLGAVDMTRSIVKSSNVYYYSLANEMGVDLIHQQLTPFGFGVKTEIDLEGEVAGILPSTDWKRRYYRKAEQQRWYAGETISLGIGQGYNNFTMLQLASATATLVSGGQRFRPRLVREIEDVVSGQRERVASDALAPLAIQPEHADLIRKALARRDAGRHVDARLHGRALRQRWQDRHGPGHWREGRREVQRRQARRAQARPLAVHRRRTHRSARPWCWPWWWRTPASAPTAAAPIARRVFDYLMLGHYPSEEDMALTREGKSGAPVGTAAPRCRDMPLPGQAVPAAAASAARSAAASP
jgi:penicillin-binding protein 2